MSSPRAATSVATSTLKLPLRKPARVISLWFCRHQTLEGSRRGLTAGLPLAAGYVVGTDQQPDGESLCTEPDRLECYILADLLIRGCTALKRAAALECRGSTLDLSQL